MFLVDQTAEGVSGILQELGVDYLVVELDFTALNVLGTGGFDLG